MSCQSRVDVFGRTHILKYTDDSRLGGMEHKVIYLVVAMDKPASILWLRMRVREKGRHFAEVWDVSDWLLGVNILDPGLSFRHRSKGLDLTVVEAGRLAERLEIYRAWRDAM